MFNPKRKGRAHVFVSGFEINIKFSSPWISQMRGPPLLSSRSQNHDFSHILGGQRLVGTLPHSYAKEKGLSHHGPNAGWLWK